LKIDWTKKQDGKTIKKEYKWEMTTRYGQREERNYYSRNLRPIILSSNIVERSVVIKLLGPMETWLSGVVQVAIRLQATETVDFLYL
jgi:hypothetical protein